MDGQLNLTGWTPNVKGEPPALEDGERVYVLFPGKAGTGRHSGPARPAVYVWVIGASDLQADMPHVMVKDEPLLGPNTIVAWCREADYPNAAQYPHVRDDLGL